MGAVAATLAGVVVTGALGYMAWVDKQEELTTAKDSLSVAQQNLEVERSKVVTAEKTLDLREQELAGVRQELDLTVQEALGGAPALRLAAARSAFERASTTAVQAQVLRNYARVIREGSKRAQPLANFHTALPSGTYEDVAFIRSALKVLPTNIDLSSADLHGVDWTGAALDRILLRDADLRAVTITGGSLAGASLEGASLSCANLEGANLSDVRLDDQVDLSCANLRGVDLSETELSTEQLLGSDWDADTAFPETVDPSIWEKAPYTSARNCARLHLRAPAASSTTRSPTPPPASVSKD